MAKFNGVIGFGFTIEIRPGVYDINVVEHMYRGDVVRNTQSTLEGQKVNGDISLDNSLSMVADQFAIEHISAIRYVGWTGTLWTVTSVEIQRPRLILRLGGVYNGPTPGASESP